MRHLALLFAIATLLLPPPTAGAQTLPRLGLRQIFGALQSNPTVPEEWAGIWEVTDSSYTCTGIFLGVGEAELDTLCAGIPITTGDSVDGIEMTCSGTATADDVHVICTGSGDVAPDCQATVTFEINGHRTGETFVVTLVANTVTQGTGLGCGSAFCQESRMAGVRDAPEPAEYCATQNLTTTWGRVKVLYR